MKMTGTGVETPYLTHQLDLARQTGEAEAREHLRRALGEAIWLVKYHTARGESELAMAAYQWVDSIMASLEQLVFEATPHKPVRRSPWDWAHHCLKLLRRLLSPVPRRHRRQPMTS